MPEPRTPSLPEALFAVTLLAVLAVGWSAMRFTTDDAHIVFRYVSNAMEGRGLVWNPAPFLPVEGYTCFSWTVILWAVWAVLGIEPPAASQGLGLLCGAGMLWLTWSLCRRVRGHADRLDRGDLITALVLIAVATNRTFLTWLSSGLETPLYSLCMLAWVHAALTKPSAGWMFRITAAAVATALTRPDGLLPVAATGVILIHAAATRPACRAPKALLAAAVPIGVFVAHLIWRRVYYGAWLPNTYYAKVIGAWPEAGLRYLGVFALEHGLWLWAIGIGGFGLIAWHRGRGGELLRSLLADRFPIACVIATITTHVGYYSLVVGGDHFGFRPFAFIVPLLFVTWFAMLSRTVPSPGLAAIAVLGFTAATHTVGWVQHARMETGGVLAFAEVTPALPAPLRPLGRAYDRWHAWLQLHWVCVRRKTHITYAEQFAQRCPSRAAGAEISWNDRPVTAEDNVGFVGWTLPHVAIIDRFGLNDWVIARTTAPSRTAQPAVLPDGVLDGLFSMVDADGSGAVDAAEVDAALLEQLPAARDREIDRRGLITLGRVLYDADGSGTLDKREFAAAVSTLAVRRMAHDRNPPPGYVEAFRPNTAVLEGSVIVAPREQPLGDDEIREAERRFRALEPAR